MGRSSVQKAPGQSQLIKTDTSAIERNGLTRPERARSGGLTWRNRAHLNEQCHKGENGKRAARTCTRHPGGYSLANVT